MAFLFCLTYSLGGRLGKCKYRYKDGGQCIIDTLPPHIEMCDEHEYLTKEMDRQAVFGLMKGRRKQRGIWYIKHNGPEARYPEAMIKWIHRKRQGE